MAAPKGKVIREYAVTVTHNDRHVLVSWDDKIQFRSLQDGWTSEAAAIREAATFLLYTDGREVEVTPNPYTLGAGAGYYTLRLRVRDQDA